MDAIFKPQFSSTFKANLFEAAFEKQILSEYFLCFPKISIP